MYYSPANSYMWDFWLVKKKDLYHIYYNTKSQVKVKNKSAREKNLTEAFLLNQKPNPRITYLVLDDVSSTGATLNECAKTIKEGGGKKVWGIVLARN